LNVEIGMIRHKIKRNAGITGIQQLIFWRDSINLLGGQRKGIIARQPVMKALDAFTDPADFPLMLRLVEARQQTLGDRQFVSMQALDHNSELLYGSLICLVMRPLKTYFAESATVDDKLQSVVDSLSHAVGITMLLRSTALLLRDQVVLLPKDITSLHEINEGMIFRDPICLKPIVRDLCQVVRMKLFSARESIDKVGKELRQALMVPGLRCDYLLSILEKNGYNILDTRLHKTQHFTACKLWWRNFRSLY